MARTTGGNLTSLNLILTSVIVISLLLPIGYIPMKAEAPGPPAYHPVIQEIIDRVSEESVEKYITDLQNFGTRYAYTAECNLSAQYIYDEFDNYSALSVENDYFMYNGYVVRNVIATLPGLNDTIDTVYVVGGHYDSTSNDKWNNAPGADDDASGTAVALEAAKILSQYRFNATIILAAWTVEELGLIGSKRWINNAGQAGMDIGAYLNFDMIGYDPDNKMGLDIGYYPDSEWLSEEMVSINENYSIGLNITTGAGGFSSDHAHFWFWNYPAAMCIESEFNTPNYHTTSDTVDKLNLDFDKRVTQLGLATLAKLAGVRTPGIGVVFLDSTAYLPSDTVTIKLYDTDMNADPDTVEFAVVQVSSDTETSPETVFLTETGANSSVFTNTIDIAPGFPASDGTLQVTEGDSITAAYNDADPTGIRVATAKVDGIPPVIENVESQPGVDTASITWTTDEPSDSRIYYGLSPSLGLELYNPEMVTSHSVEILDLEPSLTYYFDVESTDVAGNTARDDSDGGHYSFTTLPGIVTRTEEGYVGWVRQSDPTGNYFTDPDILVGNGAQGIYQGAAQFNVSWFPAGAHITNATVEFYGSRWHYMGSGGSWQLRMLNSTIDANWTTHGYWDIHNATPEDTVLPTLHDDDLRGRSWDTFAYDQAQFPELLSHLVNNTVSFRLDGPTAGRHLFIWDTGNGDGSWGPQYAPHITVAYNPVGDMEGPVISDYEIVPNPTYGASDVTISATISDASHGGSDIVKARYYDPFMNLWKDMDPVDGLYDSPTEDIQKIIDVSSWPEGTYTTYVRGLDGAGNWGVPVSIVINCWQTFHIPLYHGWNLISMPTNITDTSLANVLSSIAGQYDAVQFYDASDAGKPWKHYSISKPSQLNDLDAIDHTRGLWIHITEPGITMLKCPGQFYSVNQSIPIYPGWNHVGYPSSTNRTRDAALNNIDFGPDVDSVWTHDAEIQAWKEITEFDELEPGRGYWVHSLVTTTWEVPA